MDFTIFVSILIICDLCIVLTQSAEKGKGQDYQQTPRPDKHFIQKFLQLNKNKGVRIDQNEKMRDDTKEIHSVWTNKENRDLIRLCLNNIHDKEARSSGRFAWQKIGDEWRAHFDERPIKILKSQMNSLLKTMRNAVKAFEAQKRKQSHFYVGLPKMMDIELLKFYFITKTGDKSKHAERIYAALVKKYPSLQEVPPTYFLERAEEMLGSALKKFSLEDSRGGDTMKPGQKVDWQPVHDEYLRHLWYLYPEDVPDRDKLIYNGAVKRFPRIRFVTEKRVFNHAKWLSMKPMENHETSVLNQQSSSNAWNEGSSFDTTHHQYHKFIDDQRTPSINSGTHHNREWMASTSSSPGTSHDQPNLELGLNTFYYGNKSPDTNLKLG